MENFDDFFSSVGRTEDPYMYPSAVFDETSASPFSFLNDTYTLSEPVIDTQELMENGSGAGVIGEMRDPFPWSCQNITEFTLNDKCVENYLHTYLGPRSLPLETLVPVTIIYIIIFVTGVFGNVTTCIVILTNQYMQTATNYYLFNLAMADMTTLIVG